MKKIYKITIVFLLTILASNSYAQLSLKTGYFAENYTLRHRLNPAFAPLQGYVGMPFLSSIKFQLQGNLGAGDMLFPLADGSLGTILHPQVDNSAILNLPNYSYLNLNVDYDIFNIGWRAGDYGFWTIDWTQRINFYSSLPKEFFEFAKLGMVENPTTYEINNFSVAQNAFNEIALGFSTMIPEVKGLRVGAKVKFLLGMVDVNAGIDKMTIRMGEDFWAIKTDASGTLMGKGIELLTDEHGVVNNFKFNPKELGLAGYGVGVDLGVSYIISQDTPVDGLGFSFAVTDLGAMFFPKESVTALSAPTKNIYFGGFDNIDPNDFNNGVKGEIDKIKESLLSMTKFYIDPTAEKMTIRMLSTKLYAGINYSFLKEDRMNVGLLYTADFNPLLTLHELTASFNYMPTNWFDFSLSYSFLNVSESIGFLLNFAPKKGMNFFIGADYVSFNYTPQFLPIDHTFMNFQLGISFPIGVPMQRIAKK